ncbi:hypothetical protein [Streptomyces sp. HPF1205]|nr:hypothetical protein [Streptomyces sp. HPF1205]
MKTAWSLAPLRYWTLVAPPHRGVRREAPTRLVAQPIASVVSDADPT